MILVVVVVLAVRDPASGSVEPERRLTFTRQTPSISVGRASKVSAKGFTAAADNAWFDNPVMSRSHAELSVDFDTPSKVIPYFVVQLSRYRRHLLTIYIL